MKNEEIGKRIRQLRRRQNITQTQIYQTCGISSGNLSSIENGKTLPSSTALIQLSRTLNCTTDYILFGKDFSAEPVLSDRPDSALSEEEAQLLCAYRCLSAYDREELLMLAHWKEAHSSRIQN